MSKWNLLGENADAPQEEILRRVCVRRWKRWVLSDVRDALACDAFTWPVGVTAQGVFMPVSGGRQRAASTKDQRGARQEYKR